MKPGRAYYAGGARVVVDGVPIRLARKPSEANLAYLRMFEREKGKDVYGYLDGRAERAKATAKRAKQDILRYADRLEISESEARARIIKQRNHIIANPLRDLSLEYDL